MHRVTCQITQLCGSTREPPMLPALHMDDVVAGYVMSAHDLSPEEMMIVTKALLTIDISYPRTNSTFRLIVMLPRTLEDVEAEMQAPPAATETSSSTASNLLHGWEVPDQTKCGSCGTTSAQLQKCGQCELARYCSRECQRADWRQHKRVCPRLREHGVMLRPNPSITFTTGQPPTTEEEMNAFLQHYNLQNDDDVTFHDLSTGITQLPEVIRRDSCRTSNGLPDSLLFLECR